MERYPKNILKEKLLARVRISKITGCWNWQAKIEETGYGRMYVGKNVYDFAHRVSFIVFKRLIPPGRKKVIDHKCKNKRCVNPKHIRLVSQRTNILQSNSPAAKNARKKHCKHGHRFNKENTYIRPDGARTCKECSRRTSLTWWRENVR
jgi:hypothetical protein